MAQSKGPRDLRSDEYGLNKREFLFCLYTLAFQGKMPKRAAALAGFSGDLRKRSANLLDNLPVQRFLEQFRPPVNKFSVKSDKASLIKRLEQIASAEGVDKTVIAQLKAIELMGKAQGMWDGTSHEGKNRLAEMIAVMKAGPVARDSQPCAKCHSNCSPTARFCGDCGTLIERPTTQAPVDKLNAAKKKVGMKKEIIQ